MKVGKEIRDRFYYGIRTLPGPVKRLGKTALELYVQAMVTSGHNRFSFRYRGREIGYRYFDAPSLLYLANCLEDGRVAHESLPIALFDLPAHYDVAIDVGAHFGVYSVVLGVLNDLDLYCFEPNPENRRVLETNLAENDVEAVVDDRVVSDRTGTITFYHRQGFDSVSHSTAPPPELRDQFVRSEAESVALSSVLADADGANVFVKIDAEGEEGRIVRDLLATDGIDVLTGFLELHLDKLGEDREPILETLESEGFAYELVKRSETQPGYYFTNAAVHEEPSSFDAIDVT